MFQGQRGWFCRSVSQDLKQFWVAQGGMISDPQAAEFLFSCDASHPDTLRIYQSLDYIEDNATVFHAYYLAAVANAETKNSVVLGHFILPPECLQKEIRRKIGSFIWEQDQCFLKKKNVAVTSKEINQLKKSSELETDHGRGLSERRIYKERRDREEDLPSNDSLPKPPQRLELSQSETRSCFRVSHAGAGSQSLGPSSTAFPGHSTEEDFIRTPAVEKQMYFPLQNYPVNNMVTGYVSIESMKKFLGEIHDFIPGSSGYLAYHVQDEINMSDIKNKLKNKH